MNRKLVTWSPAIWIPVGLATAHFGGRPGRRSALRGMLSIVTAAGLGRVVGTLRPSARTSTATSVASAVAFATATSLETPRLAFPVGAVAGTTVAAAVAAGEGGRKNSVGAAALGAAAALATLKLWPRTVPTDSVPAIAPCRTTDQISSTGEGMSIAVNAAAGDPKHDEIIAQIESELPDVVIVRIGDPEQLGDELARVAQKARAIGVVGGDGTVGAAAEAAIDADIPFAVFPGGTLNHFARDARVDTVDEAIRAVRDRRVVDIDTGLIDGHIFVNTASLGSYSTLVERRERHENTIGKWPAVVLALLEMLADGKPFTLTLNGTERRIWMIFIGNCSYDPPGFAPAARCRLDDGQLDVRIVDADHPFARTRLIAALLTGRLARSAVYTRELVDHLDIDVGDSTPMLAADGETFRARSAAFRVTKNGRSLRLFTSPD